MKIDNDFKNLLPELTAEEYTGLERDIVKHGVLSPIIVWNDTIVDGHNRYAIAQAHRFPESAIPIKEINFDSKASAMQWIVDNQFAKRNLEFSQKIILQSKVHDELKKEASANTGTRTDLGVNLPHGSGGRVSEQMASKLGISEKTYRDAKYVVDHGTPEQIARMDKGGKGNGVSAIAKEIKKPSEPKPLETAEDFLKRSRAEVMAAETRTAIGVISVQAQKITKDRLNDLSEIYKKKELEEAINQVRSMIDNCQRAMDLCKSFLEVCCQ